MKRILKTVGLAVAGVVVFLGGELVYTLKRDFPLNDPEQPVAGDFGRPGTPELHFVVIGDSTSVGVGTTPENSYPWLLARWLGDRYKVRLDVVGFGGATTNDLDSQVDAALALDPDLILIEMGANDTTHAVPIPRVRSNMGTALDRLAAGSDAKVVVAGPPHMGTSPAFLEPLRTLSGWRGDAVGAAIEKEATERDLPFVDLSAATREAFEQRPKEMYSTDWFHPGTGGYKLWADVMYPTVLEAAQS